MRRRIADQATDQRPEPRTMVGFDQVSAFVGDDVVGDGEGREREAPGQADGGRAAPAGIRRMGGCGRAKRAQCAWALASNTACARRRTIRATSAGSTSPFPQPARRQPVSPSSSLGRRPSGSRRQGSPSTSRASPGASGGAGGGISSRRATSHALRSAAKPAASLRRPRLGATAIASPLARSMRSDTRRARALTRSLTASPSIRTTSPSA
jgi:hypothetical protein